MGHRGVRAALDLLQQRNYIWNTTNSDVPKLILQCPTCQKLNVRQLDYQTHPFTTATYRSHDQINVDTLVLNQPDKLGNLAIIVVIDTSTRWLELYPIPNYTEEVAALKLLEHFGRYGPPKQILTDQSNLLTTHSHQHNLKVENAKRQVLRHLRAVLFEECVMED